MYCENCTCQNCVSNNAKERIKDFFNEMRFELSDKDREFISNFLDCIKECHISYSDIETILNDEIININDFVLKVVNINNFDAVQMYYSITDREKINELHNSFTFSNAAKYFNIVDIYQESIIEDLLNILVDNKSDIQYIKELLKQHQIIFNIYIKNSIKYLNFQNDKILLIFEIYQLLVN